MKIEIGSVSRVKMRRNMKHTGRLLLSRVVKMNISYLKSEHNSLNIDGKCLLSIDIICAEKGKLHYTS